jgi:AraC-like DNA-binding protein
MERLNEILSAMRLSGGVFLDAEMRGDFSLASEFTPMLCSQFFPVRGPIVSYHFVREGALWAEIDGERHWVEQGSIILFPRNRPHRLYNAEVPTVDADDYVEPPEDDGPMRLRLGTGEVPVRIFCGFLSAESETNPLLERLPEMLVLETDKDQGAWVDATINFVAGEAGRSTPSLVGKLAEPMFVEAVRLYFDQDEQARRMADALSDPRLGRAIDYINAHLGEDIDVEDLAREAGMSRSALADRFVSILGEPPIRYAARCKMRRAADLLEQGESLAEVAHQVGFSSEASFTRAFKREFGEPPASWRRNRAGD